MRGQNSGCRRQTLSGAALLPINKKADFVDTSEVTAAGDFGEMRAHSVHRSGPDIQRPWVYELQQAFKECAKPASFVREAAPLPDETGDKRITYLIMGAGKHLLI